MATIIGVPGGRVKFGFRDIPIGPIVMEMSENNVNMSLSMKNVTMEKEEREVIMENVTS